MTSRLSLFKRTAKFNFEDSHAFILLGPRKTGKTTLLKELFPQAVYIDLLKSDVRAEYQLYPSRLREKTLAQSKHFLIIDEIQKVPELLDEVHWLLENTKLHFILCGSSARKLKRGAANLLGGRAFKFEMFPLTCFEIFSSKKLKFSIEEVVNRGQIPQHLMSKKYNTFLKAYVELYLQEEIMEESQIRKLQSFHRFLQVSALMNGELLNYSNVASDCGVSAKTVREYYQLLIDTLLGFELAPWAKVKTRKLIETSKFYLFDTGVVRYLKEIELVPLKTTEFGNLFETLIINEVRAYLSYHQRFQSLSFWRTKSNFEVDLIIGKMEVAIEIKSSGQLRSEDFKGLKALLEEHQPEKSILVCLEPEERFLENGIWILPLKKFVEKLWSHQIIKN